MTTTTTDHATLLADAMRVLERAAAAFHVETGDHPLPYGECRRALCREAHDLRARWRSIEGPPLRCPDCGELRPGDERVAAGMHCAECNYAR